LFLILALQNLDYHTLVPNSVLALHCYICCARFDHPLAPKKPNSEKGSEIKKGRRKSNTAKYEEPTLGPCPLGNFLPEVLF
jgi:hypothetical protein